VPWKLPGKHTSHIFQTWFGVVGPFGVESGVKTFGTFEVLELLSSLVIVYHEHPVRRMSQVHLVAQQLAEFTMKSSAEPTASALVRVCNFTARKIN
jgi:hypothetical protein